MAISLTKRRLLLGAGVFALGLLVAGLAARIYLTGLAIGAALKEAGAVEVRFQVTQASLWRVVVEDVGFLLRLQPYAARRVTLDRTHWWTPSLGTLRVEEARVPVKVADLVKAQPPAPTPSSPGPTSLPFEEISIDGQLVMQAEGLPDQALTVKLQARPLNETAWTANAQVTGPGLGLSGEGQYDLVSGDLSFKVPEFSLDLKPWQEFGQRLVDVPMEDWAVEGKLSGQAEGRLVGDKLTAAGSVRLREGRAVSTAEAITAEGIEADLEFTDFDSVTTKPGTLRVREVVTGQLPIRDLRAEVALRGTDRIVVSQISLQALGGVLSADPFEYVPSKSELDAVLHVDGISIEQVMALTEDLPAKASGRVNGRFPIKIDADGWRMGTGWLELKPGVYAELELHAKGLLTGGASPKSPGYAVLQKVESGLLKLKISELRLDIRPPNAPEGRSAQLHIRGEPVDPEVKAPVILDLNVNGPLERLISLGMNSRLSFGSGK